MTWMRRVCASLRYELAGKEAKRIIDFLWQMCVDAKSDEFRLRMRMKHLAMQR